MIYVVTDKVTGDEVYRYDADAPVEWDVNSNNAA